MTDSRNRLLVAVAVVTAAGCLPRGAPPAGRQIVADRAASLGAMVPPNGDGILRVLFMRPNADPGGADLYVVSVDASGEPSPERMLIADIVADDDLGCTWKIAPCSFDAKGRISVFPNNAPTPPPGGPFPGPVLVDPVTGELTQTTTFTAYASASGQRTFVMDPYVQGGPQPSAGTLTDADGHTTRLQFGTSDQSFGLPIFFDFIGEDFYYVDPNDNLIDLPPSDVPQQLATAVIGVQFWVTPDGPLLLLSGPTSDPTVDQLSIRDPATGVVTVLPFTGSGLPVWSSDYRYMFFQAATYDQASMTASYAYYLFDRSSDTTQTLNFPSTEYVSAQWRPGQDQLWTSTGYGAPTPAVTILSPGGGSPITVTGRRFQGFAESGTYWFSTTDDPNKSNPAMDVGLADDPTGPVYPFNAPGTYIDGEWELPDGRIVESTYVSDNQRADATVVDPRTGASQVLAERGRVAAFGLTRFMGMYHFVGGRGDLTFVELDNGRSTVLAPEFTVTAFAEPQGTDLLAPGTRVIYQFQARTDSPYDGIWLVNSP